jgi:LysR family transcriptional regulator, glycine cleavage system transcriptional activator
MVLRLPPLGTLRIFDAAARRLSFTLAAADMHLTPSAVSHGIRTLELWLGTELFRRDGRSLALSSEGENYARLVGQALEMLAEATDRLPGRRATGSLFVSSEPPFARRWLLPRLAGFTRQFPDIRITMDTSGGPAALEEVDIAIRMSNIDKPADNRVRLVQEELVPVCSPSLKAQLDRLTPAEILARGPLIRVTGGSADWDQWFEATGTEPPPSREAGLHVDSVLMGLDAATHGLGIVLGRRPLVDEDLERGRLVRAIDHAAPSGYWYWMITKDSTFDRPEVKLFRKWMLYELGDGVGR